MEKKGQPPVRNKKMEKHIEKFKEKFLKECKMYNPSESPVSIDFKKRLKETK